jgi:hypothetical protein
MSKDALDRTAAAALLEYVKELPLKARSRLRTSYGVLGRSSMRDQSDSKDKDDEWAFVVPYSSLLPNDAEQRRHEPAGSSTR